MFSFFVSYGSDVLVTVAVYQNGEPDVASAASGRTIEGAFRVAFERTLGRKPKASETKFFLNQVRQRESLEAQPQNVGL